MQIRWAKREPGSLDLGLLYGGLTLVALLMVPLFMKVLPQGLGKMVLCPLRAWTGYPCPTCGTTRALWALGHGDLSGAWGFNPLFVLAVGGLLLWGAASLVAWASGGRWEMQLSHRERNGLRLGGAGLVAANWVYLILRL